MRDGTIIGCAAVLMASYGEPPAYGILYKYLSFFSSNRVRTAGLSNPANVNIVKRLT